MTEHTRRHASAALVVAHPGHELRVYGWLEAARPRVFVLTDGSGREGRSRVGATDEVLAAAGAAPGDIYARLSDAAFYAVILDHDFELFTSLADELAASLVRERVGRVAGDAAEGYHPAHDACRMIVNAAVEMAARALGREIVNLDFTLVGRPDLCPEESRARAVWVRLDEATFARKLRAARCYPGLAAEVEAALAGAGTVAMQTNPDLAAESGFDGGGAGSDLFRVECLRPAAGNVGAFDEPPFYERYAEREVAAGRYARVLRYREHMLPLAGALRSHVEKRNR